MSFMYQTMLSRAPGKRKIKLQEENILRLMQEDDPDEEEDMDFEVAHDHEERNGSGSESGTSDSAEDSNSSSDDESESGNENEPSTSKKLPKRTQYNDNGIPSSLKDHGSVPTIKSTNDMINSKYYNVPHPIVDVLKKAEKQLKVSTTYVKRNVDLSQVRTCCICLKHNESAHLLTCHKCFITVHKECCRTRKLKSMKKSWFCDVCISAQPQSCELCPSNEGCLKETNTGQWCHVVCARYILKSNIFSSNPKSNVIDFSNLNYKLYGSKECYLCEDRLVSKTGICVKCDAGLCKVYFHVTCAQKHGLLSENETGMNSATDPYFVYCPHHVNKEEVETSQKVSLACFAAVKYACKRKKLNSNRKIRLNKCTRRYIYSLNERPKLPLKPGPPPARLLSSNAEALLQLNNKAELMYNINVRSPATYFPSPSKVRRRHRVAPNLTGEFVSHYADRELRISEAKERINEELEKNQLLMTEQSKLRQQYEEVQNTLFEERRKQRDLKTSSQHLYSFISSLKEWVKLNHNKLSNDKHTNAKRARLSLHPLVHVVQDTEEETSESPNQLLDVELNGSDSEDYNRNMTSHLLKSCNICKSDNKQHLLVECDVCNQWSHLGCLDPPLTQMPRKTKFALWQCSECAPSNDVATSSESDDDQHGSLITEEGRRLTRRIHRPPEKLSTTLLNDQQLFEQRRMMNYIQRSFKTGSLKKRKLSRDRLRMLKKKYMSSSNNHKITTTSSSEYTSSNSIALKSSSLKKEVTSLPPVTVTIPKPLQDTKPIVTSQPMFVNNNHIRPQVQIKPLEKMTLPLPISHVVFKKTENTSLKNEPDSVVPADEKNEPVSITELQTNVIKVLNDVSKTLTCHTWKPAVITTPAHSHPRKPTIIRTKSWKPNILMKSKITPLSTVSTLKSKNPRFIVSPMKMLTNLNGLMTKCTVVRAGSITEKLQKIVNDLKADAERTSPLHGSNILMKKPVVPIKQLPESKPKVTLAENNSCFSNSIQSKQPVEVVSKLCQVCKNKNEPLKMMQCFKCNYHYHIWCCDPPRTSVPKPSKFSYWVCSNCTLNGSDEENPQGGLEVAPDGRKRITRCRKPPEKFVNTIHMANAMHNARIRKTRCMASRRKRKKSKPEIPQQCNTATQPPYIHKLPPLFIPAVDTPSMDRCENTTPTTTASSTVTSSLDSNSTTTYIIKQPAMPAIAPIDPTTTQLIVRKEVKLAEMKPLILPETSTSTTNEKNYIKVTLQHGDKTFNKYLAAHSFT
ncbi:uncharacterized protein LOC100179204 [Ciona intestinalis]